MFIIRKGDLSLLKRYKQFECKSCRCIFVASHEEYHDCSTQREGAEFKMTCPTCGTLTYNHSYDCISEPDMRQVIEEV